MILRFIKLIVFTGKYIRKNGFINTLLKAINLFINNRPRTIIESVYATARVEGSISNLKIQKSEYFQEIQDALKISPHFKEYEEKTEKVSGNRKLISFYLPQFHPFEENNTFWGKGFTEWTNVSKSYPLFAGHYQPRLPKDLGFYDLRLKETIFEQSKLAKNYGIHGFAFHYYWFSGHKVMDTPINILYENKEIDLNFCICWANENWTRRWDGNEKDVLLEQKDHPDDYLNFFNDISKYLQDSRYIQVEGKPVIIIYRTELLKDAAKAAKIWREEARKIGFPDLHLILSESFVANDPQKFGFDASLDFAPNNFPLEEITRSLTYYHPDFKGRVFNYPSVVEHSLTKIKHYPFYYSACLAWDNSARKGNKGTILHRCTPAVFGDWIKKLVNEKAFNEIVFINAWNEWAEGTYLEPDRKYGFAYLDQCYEALKSFDRTIS